MKSYGQYCAVAKALDVVGDRWNLLIVRELLARSPLRYTDLRAGLPGIATNLLGDRLRDLEGGGVIHRFDAPPPIATTVYELTPRGRQLWPVLRELGNWGSSLLADPSSGDAEDDFRLHWLAVPARIHLSDHLPDQPPVSVELRSGREALTIEANAGVINVHTGHSSLPDAVLAGPHHLLVGVLFGDLTLEQALAHGLSVEGDTTVITRLRPSVPTGNPAQSH